MDWTDISSIERKTLIRAPRERVWRALTDTAEFSKWFGVRTDGQFAPGARLRMTSTHPGEYEGVAFDMTVVEMTPPKAFSWRWHPGAEQPPAGDTTATTTLVTFRLDEVPGGTLVTVFESGFDQISLERRARVYQDNTQGWEFQMKSLESYVGQPA